MSDAPSVEPSRIERFYQELADMQVVLDADPLALGPKRMNAKTAECRALLSRTERIFLEVSQDLYWYKREHRRALADFELAVKDLLSNDPVVRSNRSATDREAVCHTKLRTDKEKISTLQFACEDLEAVLSVVKTKRNDLKDIASRLRDQLKICQEEIGLGARWSRGKSRDTESHGSESTPNSSTDSVVAAMDEILARMDTSVTTEELEASDDEGSDPIPPVTTQSDQEIDSFLGNITDSIQEPDIVVPKIDLHLDELLDLFDS
jgi:hypothetical protein